MYKGNIYRFRKSRIEKHRARGIFLLRCSTSPDSGSGLDVGSGDGIVDVEHDSGLATSVDTRDRDKRTRCAAATVNNVDLGAADVELGTTEARCAVQSNVLNADEILAAGQGLWDGEHRAIGIGRPGDGGSTVGSSSELVDLEPNLPRAVKGGGIAV